MARSKVEICGISTSQLQVLSNQEMQQLFLRLQKGDESAKEALIRGNLKLVLSISQRFLYRCDNMDDLFQVGCIGLIKAIEHFDLAHEVRFSTYAVPMIIGEMKRYLRDNQGMRISRNLKDLAYKIAKLKEVYRQENAKEASVKYLAIQLQVSEKEIVEAMQASQSLVSIYEPVYNGDGDELYLVDQIKDEQDEIKKIQDKMALYKSLTSLKKKELLILQRRYYQDLTQSEVAKELQISQAQVSRIEKQALQTLKKVMEK